MLGEYFKQMTSKVVIVTGASRGIGLAVAESLLQQGNRVFLVARTAAPLQALKDKHPDQVEFLVGDLTTKDVRIE
jgi:NADP-dependent 3-hydroxy acid dehydrogenase YdfG